MNEMQQLLSTLTALEEEMKRFSGLVKEVMSSITMQEFVPEKANTDMMQCIMELNTKQKECLKLYKQAKLGDTPPKKLRIMRDQIEKRKGSDRKIEYLESVKKSFLSLYTENEDVDAKLQEFKEKIVTIKVDKYPLEKCLVYIRPFAVFLTMIKADDPVKAIEQVPVLNDYFGSALVAHITISKDIFIGEDAAEFTLEGEEASESPKGSTVKPKKESVQNVGSANNQSATAGAGKKGETATIDKSSVASKENKVASQSGAVAQSQQMKDPRLAAQAAVQPTAQAAVQSTVQASAQSAAQVSTQPAAQPEVKAEEPKPAVQTAAQPEVKAEEPQAAAQTAAQPEVKAEEPQAVAQTAAQPEVKAEEPQTAAQAAAQPEVKAEEPKPAAQEKAQSKSKESAPEKDAPVAKPKKVPADNKKRTKPKRPKKVDLKALLEEDGFREDRLDDPELRKMQEQEQKGKKGKKDSNLSLLKGPNTPGAF